MSEQWIPESHGLPDPNGWPDPQRPGVPLNPERDRAHAFDDHGVSLVLLWRTGWWIGPLSASSKPHELAARRVRYLGPCLPPDEVAAQLQEAQAQVARLLEALRDIAADCEADYPPSHGAIKYVCHLAIKECCHD